MRGDATVLLSLAYAAALGGWLPLGAWLLLGAAPVALAQAPASGEPASGEPGVEARDEARRLFERADELLVEGRFAEARDLLRRSLETYRHSATAFNLAVALRGTGDALAAAELLEALLDEDYGALRAEQRREVEALRAELGEDIVEVTLRVCGGQDVSVRFDGALWRRFDGCRTLTRAANAGRHVLTANGAGRLPLEETVQLARGEPWRGERTLAPLPTGELVVRVPRDDARVEVVGVGVGLGGFRRSLPAGAYQVRAFLDPAAPEERSVDLEAGAVLELALGQGGGDAWVVILAVALGGAALAAGVITATVLVQQAQVRPLVRDEVFDVTETLSAAPGVRF